MANNFALRCKQQRNRDYLPTIFSDATIYPDSVSAYDPTITKSPHHRLEKQNIEMNSFIAKALVCFCQGESSEIGATVVARSNDGKAFVATEQHQEDGSTLIFALDQEGKTYGCRIMPGGERRDFPTMPDNKGKPDTSLIFTAVLIQTAAAESDFAKVLETIKEEYENNGTISKDDLFYVIDTIESRLDLGPTEPKKIIVSFSAGAVNKPITKAALERYDFGGEVVLGKPKMLVKAQTVSTSKFKTFGELKNSPTAVRFREEIKNIFSEEEKLLIPKFPDDMPCFPEVESVLNCFFSTRGYKIAINTVGLLGESGYGKSTASKQIAGIMGLPYRNFTCSDATMTEELLTKFSPSCNEMREFKGYELVMASFAETFEKGGLCEIAEASVCKNRGALVGINEYFDRTSVMQLADGTYVKRHPYMFTIYTDNDTSYEARRPLDQAVKRRRRIPFHIHEMEKDEVMERIRYNVDGWDTARTPILENMYTIWEEVRKWLKDRQIVGVCGLTELETWAMVVKANDYDYARHWATDIIVNNAVEDDNDAAELETVIEKLFKSA